MTAEEIVYDILEIKNALEDDRDLDELWLLNKINMYRSVFIAMNYVQNQEIESIWVQRLRKQKVVRTTPADDPSITNSSIVVGKVTLPNIISLPGDVGLVRVTGSSGILSFDQIDFDTLMLKIAFKEEKMGEFGYCARVGNDLFIYPLVREIQAMLIAEDPFGIQVMGSNGQLRDMLVTDEYPLDMATAQRIALEILTKDLMFNAQSVSDIVNDSQNQLKILQNAGGQRQAAD